MGSASFVDSFESVPGHELLALSVICGLLLSCLLIYALFLIRRNSLRRRNTKRGLPLLTLKQKLIQQRPGPVIETETMSTIA